MKTGATVVLDRFAQVVAGVHALTTQRVMVGVPADKGDRKADEGQTGINNAALAYIHNFGAPEAGIPQREFMASGLTTRRNEIIDGLKRAGELALEGKASAVERQFHRVGMIGRDAIKAKLRAGPFAPLAPATIAARRRRGKGSKYRRKATTAADVKPLIDTAQMLNSINYVLRKLGLR